MELGVAAIPPTDFYTEPNKHLAQDYLRFAFCKDDDVLEKAKERLRGLKKFMVWWDGEFSDQAHPLERSA